MEVSFADGIRIAVDEHGHATAGWAAGTFGVVVRATAGGREAALALPQLVGHTDGDRALIPELVLAEQRALEAIGPCAGMAGVLARSPRASGIHVGFAAGAPPRFHRAPGPRGREHWLAAPPWIAYEWGPGSLERVIADEAPLAVADAFHICRTLLTALAHLHAQTHIHGDVRAEHVRFETFGGVRRYFFVEHAGPAARGPALRVPGAVWVLPRLQTSLEHAPERRRCQVAAWRDARVRRLRRGFALQRAEDLDVAPGDLVRVGSRVVEVAHASADQLVCAPWWAELAGARIARTRSMDELPERFEAGDAQVVPAPTARSDLYGIGVIALRLLVRAPRLDAPSELVLPADPARRRMLRFALGCLARGATAPGALRALAEAA